MKYSPKYRLRLVSVVIVILALFFGAKLFFLQVVRGGEYSIIADSQYLKSAPTFFDRGSIYFSRRDGSLVPAATLKQEFVASANPRMIINPEAVYAELKTVIDFDKEDWLRRANNKDSAFEVVATGLDLKTAEQIKSLNLKGIFVRKEKRRFYPGANTASHLLGFMAYQGEDYAGRYGLEQEYEDILSHKDSGSFANFFAEIFLSAGKTILKQEGQQGDIILTIEPTVQNVLEAELIKTAQKWNAQGAGGIIMDPKTGAILAMAAWPDFDPGIGVSDISLLTNPLVERVYEMGSVVKPLTIASGIDAEVITPQTTYYDSGCLVLNTRQICNYDGKGRGTVDMQTVLNQSLNTGVTFVAQQLGRERFRNYMLGFGLGELTGIDLPNEATGLVANLDSKREVEHATASFGQGIAITPIAMIRAFATLANGGWLINPFIVQSIKFDDGLDRIIEPETGKRVISDKAAKAVTNMLIKTVDEALVGGQYSMEHYTVAAKTGTAQMSDEVNGGYYEDRFLHSFFGYYPARQPKFISFIYLINPRGARYASETLTEPFMNNAKFLLNYYEVTPDR